MPQDYEKSKPRESDAQKKYDEADNAGRFSGNDVDSKQARQQGVNDIKEETGIKPGQQTDSAYSDGTDVLARRDGAQSQDYKGEAQNVNDDTGRPLDEQELTHARNKANEAGQQGRGDSVNRNNQVNRGQSDEKGRG